VHDLRNIGWSDDKTVPTNAKRKKEAGDQGREDYVCSLDHSRAQPFVSG